LTKHTFLFVLLLTSALVSHAAEPPRITLTAWQFDNGIANRWGGVYNTYMKEPSSVRTYLDPRVTRAPGGHSLRVTAHRSSDGFCGVWMDFHPASQVPRQYLDVSQHRYLSFWARGAKGGESFEIELTDEATVEDEAARPRRPLSAYLPQGLSTTWQEIVIPLADFHGIDLRKLARMNFDITQRGDYQFYLDDISFKRERAARPSREDPKTDSIARRAVGSVPRAMWVWNTKPLFDPAHREEADRFFDFCARNGIREIYLAVELESPAKEKAPVFEVRDPDGYQEFLKRAHRAGLQVEGLMGTPEWGVRENHAEALSAVDAVVAYNNSRPAEARLDGTHFDVEPYVLIGYSAPQYRPQILTEFLELIDQSAARSRAGGLRFSCDVPSWFFPSEDLERERMTVSFKGAEKTVGEHLTDLLESLTIMDYTNRADGAGGIIARGLPALRTASTRNKKIMVGLETFSESESAVSFACGLPAEEFRSRLASSGLRNQLYFEDFRMSVYSDDVNMHVGLSMGRENSPEKRAACQGALAKLSRQFGASSDPDRFPAAPMLEIARAALTGDTEWAGFEPFEFTDLESGKIIIGFRTAHRMQPGITFHGMGRKTFEEEYDSAVEWLGSQPGFGGMAIHFYDSFRELMEGKEQESEVRSQNLAPARK